MSAITRERLRRHAASVGGIRTPDRPRTWRARPDRRWGWLSNDGYELEWRRPEGGMPRGYYLFGPGTDGIWCGAESKALVQQWADATIAECNEATMSRDLLTEVREYLDEAIDDRELDIEGLTHELNKLRAARAALGGSDIGSGNSPHDVRNGPGDGWAYETTSGSWLAVGSAAPSPSSEVAKAEQPQVADLPSAPDQDRAAGDSNVPLEVEAAPIPPTAPPAAHEPRET